MSLSLSLNNALSGLRVNQAALSVLSQNIANANTAGYSRQIVTQSGVYTAGQGSGVRLNDITRVVDQYLQRSIQTQTGKVAGSDIRNEYLSRLQILMGQPGQQNSIDYGVTNFFNSVQAVAQSPELASFQVTAVNSGVALARQISGLASDVQDLRYQADQEIKQTVTNINQKVQELHLLNVKLAEESVLGQASPGTLDQRDMLIKSISEYADVQVQYKNDGTVNVFTGAGVTLLDESAYQLTYTAASSVTNFTNNGNLNPIQVFRVDEQGNKVGQPTTLVTGGTQDSIATSLQSGKLKALVELRDKNFKSVLTQLDALAANVRDQVNALHNNGSGFPGNTSLTGTKLVSATARNDWSGSVQIAVLDSLGKPVNMGYAGGGGLKPLTLDLANLNSGYGAGTPSNQTLINEINNYFGAPGAKAGLGNLDNIRLVSGSALIPSGSNNFNFSLELNNNSATSSDFFVTGVTVLDNTGASMGAPASTIPSFSIANYTTVNASTTVHVTTGSAHGFTEGQRVYMNAPAGAVNGVPAGDLGGFFTVTNVSATGYDIEVATPATSASSVAGTTQVLPHYDNAAPGEMKQTGSQGSFTASVSGNPTSPYYDVTMNVAVDDGAGGFTTGQVTYRVYNSTVDQLGDRYNATSVAGGATLTQPTTSQGYARAILVDANGNELAQTNGSYGSQEGYLKIVTTNPEYRISISELDSRENGLASDNPPRAGSGRGFSYYFELNNFFKGNDGKVEGSALNLQVEDRILQNPSLLTTGRLERSVQSGANPVYTYQRSIGNNAAALALAGLSTATLNFGNTAGIPASAQTLNAFAGQILGFTGAQAATAEADLTNSQTLLDGFNQRSQSISGVNIDEELANTIIYQNAYTASARVVTVTNQLFSDLLGIFG